MGISAPPSSSPKHPPPSSSSISAPPRSKPPCKISCKSASCSSSCKMASSSSSSSSACTSSTSSASPWCQVWNICCPPSLPWSWLQLPQDVQPRRLSLSSSPAGLAMTCGGVLIPHRVICFSCTVHLLLHK